MRILFGMVLTVLRGRLINENMVWTDSQDYGADEILPPMVQILLGIKIPLKSPNMPPNEALLLTPDASYESEG
jgi:hypothetical protein